VLVGGQEPSAGADGVDETVLDEGGDAGAVAVVVSEGGTQLAAPELPARGRVETDQELRLAFVPQGVELALRDGDAREARSRIDAPQNLRALLTPVVDEPCLP
jgi:hypothetical protein